jgi:hypothetical protein
LLEIIQSCSPFFRVLSLCGIPTLQSFFQWSLRFSDSFGTYQFVEEWGVIGYA